jgi:hypothetical protein
MELERLLSYSQQPATGPYPESDEHNARPHNLVFYDPF